METHATKLLAQLRNTPPIGALAVFIAAYVAFLLGHFAALVVVAFLVGLHLANQQPADKVSAEKTAPPIPTIKAADLVAAVAPQPASPIADALANGLTIRKIEFSQAAAPKKTSKQTVSAA